MPPDLFRKDEIGPLKTPNVLENRDTARLKMSEQVIDTTTRIVTHNVEKQSPIAMPERQKQCV
jgi:hypothetical protein